MDKTCKETDKCYDIGTGDDEVLAHIIQPNAHCQGPDIKKFRMSML